MMLRALLTIGAAQFVTMLVLVVRTKTLALLLGPELVGVMAVIDKLLAVIAQTASLSLPFAAVRFLPERWAAGPSEFRDLFTRMRNLLLAMILAAAVGALAVSAFFPAAWGVALLPYHDVMIVALLGLPAVALIPFLQNAIAGRMQQNRSMLVGFLQALVLTASVAGIWLGGLPGYYAAYAVLGTILVAGVTRLATEGADKRSTRSRPRLAMGLPAPIWRFSAALLVLAFFSPYAILFVHYRLLSEHGAEAAGWMQAAIGISLSVRAVLGSAHAVFLTPNVNRGGSVEERMQWANRFQATLCLIAGLSVPPLLLFPTLVVHLLYSSAFLPGAAFVMLFVLAEIVGLLSGTYQTLVVAFGHMRFHVLSNLVAQLLVVAVGYQLVGPFGILGAGLAALVAPVFLLVATSLFLNRRHGLRMPRRLVARCGWLLTGLVAAGLTGVFFAGPLWESLLYKAAIYLVFAGVLAFLLADHERKQIRDALEGLKARWT